MKVIAIICEYNPFHKGHERQINIIRDSFGPDCAILSLMSGNWVQRGEAAVCDKYSRAKAAIMCGSDVVLELPYPWSSSCAEHFARVLSFISTAVRHGISSFDACLSLRNGTALALVESWQD